MRAGGREFPLASREKAESALDIGTRATISAPRRWLAVSCGAVTAAALVGCGSSPTAGNSAAAARARSSEAASTVDGRAGCVTSAVKGSCGPYTYAQIEGSSQGPTVGQNVWNPISGWHQALAATGPGDWSATANMPAGNTAVVSFPNTGAGYGDQPVSKIKTIYSSFSENMNATSKTSAWAAYDLWFNNWHNEVMIQHDFANNAACPFVATQSFGGSGGVPVRKWGLCKYGDELIWKLTGGSEHRGSVDILSMVTWLEKHGYMASASTITALSYGFEICSTGGQNETFHVSSFSISATQAG
jgi:hypothetical protein